MINETFDDDIPDDDELTIEPVHEEPKGDFSRTLDGRTIWFNAPIPGQFHAWKRHRESLISRFEKLRKRAETETTLEMLRELSEVSEKLDMLTLELVESLMVSGDDVDFVAMGMVGGRITMIDIHQVLFGDPEPDDDQPDAPKPPKKKIPKKVTAAKKKNTANASRTRR